MGDRAIRWLVGGLGLLVGIAAELVQRGHAIPAERLLVDFLVGQAYLMGGLFAWSREPRNRTWKLMAGVGIAWYVGSFAAARSRSSETWPSCSPMRTPSSSSPWCSPTPPAAWSAHPSASWSSVGRSG